MLSIKDIPNNLHKQNKGSQRSSSQIHTKQNKKIGVHNANTLKKITKILTKTIR